MAFEEFTGALDAPDSDGSFVEFDGKLDDDSGQFVKGAKTGVTGLKSMWESAGVLKDALAAQKSQSALKMFDDIEFGRVAKPEQLDTRTPQQKQRGDLPDFAAQQARQYLTAAPDIREAMRSQLSGDLSSRKELVAASLETMRKYQEDSQRTNGRVPDLTDVAGVNDFKDWLAFNAGSGAVSMAPIILAAVATGGLGAGALGYGMAVSDLNKDRIDDVTKKNGTTDDVIKRVQDTSGSTFGAAVPYAALDVLAGPVRGVVSNAAKSGLKKQTMKQVAKEVPGDLLEEGLAEGAQEAIKIGTSVVLGEEDKFFTTENAKRIFNAGAAGAAGAPLGTGIKAAQTFAKTEPAEPIAPKPDPVQTILQAGTVDDAITAAMESTTEQPIAKASDADLLARLTQAQPEQARQTEPAPPIETPAPVEPPVELPPIAWPEQAESSEPTAMQLAMQAAQQKAADVSTTPDFPRPVATSGRVGGADTSASMGTGATYGERLGADAARLGNSGVVEPNQQPALDAAGPLNFSFTKNASGTVLVDGDPAAIRAAFPDAQGMVKYTDGQPSGVLFSTRSSPSVLAQLETPRVQNPAQRTNPETTQAARSEAPAAARPIATGQPAARAEAGSPKLEADGLKPADQRLVPMSKRNTAPTMSLAKESSWVIKNKQTGEVVMETFDKKKVESLNTAKYEAVPIQEHLGGLNRKIKDADATPADPRLIPVSKRGTPDKQKAIAAGRVKMEAMRVPRATETGSQAAPEPVQPAQGKEVSRYIGKFNKGMGRDAARLEASRLNRTSTDKAITYTAEEHDDPKLENPYAVVGRKVFTQPERKEKQPIAPVQTEKVATETVADAKQDEAPVPANPVDQGGTTGEKSAPKEDAPQFSRESVKPDPKTAKAIEFLNAAKVFGMDRLNLLKSIKDGSLTQEELQSAYPDVKSSETEDQDYDFTKPTGQDGGRGDSQPAVARGSGQADPGRAAEKSQNLRTTVSGKPARQGWASATRAVGKDGLPLTIYRAARRNLSPADFKKESLGFATGNAPSGLGVWSSASKDDAARHGPILEEFHLDLRNPLTFKAGTLPGFDTAADAFKFREALRMKGYDGLIVDYTSIGGPKQFVAFDAEQVIHAGDKTQFSRGNSSARGITQDQFNAELSKAFGSKVAEKLQAKGVVVPLADQTKLPSHVVPFLRDGDIVFGFYDHKTNKTYAVLKNLTQDMVKGLVLHEVGVHYGFENMLGAAKYANIVKRLDLMRRAGNKAVKAAHAEAVANAVNEYQVTEEMLAYLVQNHPENGVVAEIIARIKAFLFNNFGIGGNYLTPADIQMLARAAVDHASRTEDGGSLVPAFMREGGKPDQTETPEFKNWFGDSKVVDADGKPLVVYRGQKTEGNPGPIAYFSADPAHAKDYASGEGGNIAPVYLSMRNPLEMTNEEYWAKGINKGEPTEKAMLLKAKAKGHDGIIVRGFQDNAAPADMFITTSSEQIKSATGNSGTFDPTNPDIRFSRAPASPSTGLPEETRLQKVQRVMQDKYNRVKLIQDLLREDGGTVGDQQDVYKAEERMHGRVHEVLRDFADEVIHPLIKKATDFKVDLNELAAYAYAKHAAERNAQIQTINKNVKTGSGMSDADAQAAIDAVKATGKFAQFEELHADLMAITSTTRRLMVDEGLITQEQYDSLENQYENYVPLRGFEDVEPDSGNVRPGLGRGFNTKGKETIAAMGRDSKAGDIIENIIRDYERATIRAERNSVGKTFLDLVTSNPDPKLWEVQPMTRATRKVNGLVEYVDTPDKGGDTISVKVGGEQVYIKINDPLLLRAMANTFKAETSDAERFLSSTLGLYTSLLRNTITRYNPAFGVINAVRDVQMGAMGVYDELGAEGVRRYAANYGAAVASSGRTEMGKSDPQNKNMDKWMREMRFAGGTTGGVFMRDHDTIKRELRDTMLQAGVKPNGVIEGVRASGAWKAAGKVLHGLELIGSMSENSARLAAYATAREMGKTPAQAASIAKNLTVNFNRFGEQGQLINTAFLFYNASVQGTVRIAQMAKNPKVRKAFAGMAAAGMGLALMGAAVGGDDEDGQPYWDKIPDFEKERNLIIMLPPGTDMGEKVGTHGRYIKLPMAYGLNVFPVLGYQLADLARNAKDPAKGVGPTKAAINMVSAIAGSYNPAGGSFDPRDKVQLAMAVSPTIVDAGIQLGAGVDSFGKPTGPQKSPYDKDPDSETVSSQNHGNINHRIARWLNETTGGNRARAGAIDIEPGTIKNVQGILAGGLGKFVGDVVNLGYLGATDAPIKDRDIPIWKAFYGEYNESSGMSQYYERSRKAMEELDDMKSERKLGIKRDYSSEEKFLQGMGDYAELVNKRFGDLKKKEVQIAESNGTAKEKELKRRMIQKSREKMAEDFNTRWYAKESELKRKD